MRTSDLGRSLAWGVAALALIPAGGWVVPAVAQESGATELERIVITGRKRTEAEERAPVSVTVVEPDEVPPTTLDPGPAIARQAPNTNFIDYARFGDSFLNIRGISTLGSPLNSLDSTIGFSVDGVPTSISGFAPPLLDLEQVEVLRGPQGTTFGRNSLGGAVNVVSRKADGERELRLDAGIGLDGYAFAQGTAGGWIVPDVVAARGVVRFQHFGGDVPNPYLGEKVGDAQLGAARGTVRITPDDTWTIDITGNYSRDERNNPNFILLGHPNFPTSGEDVLPINRRKIAQGTVDIRKEFDDFTVTSTTSYQDVGIYNFADFTDAYVFGMGFNPATDKVETGESEQLFTHELRINSAEDADWQWVAGLSYFHSDYRLLRRAGVPLIPTFNGQFDNKIVSDTFAVFGDVTVPLGERFEVSGGLRLAHDRQSFLGNYDSLGYPVPFPTFTQSGKVSDTYLTGRAALSYRWTDDIMSYASIARGYSSGGFEKSAQYSGFGIPSPPFAPAKGWTYEVGTKANLTERLSLRGAVFYNDIADGVLSGFDNTTFQIFMANQDFRSFGFEAGADVEITDGLNLSAGIGYTKSEMVGVIPGSDAEKAGAVNGNAVPQVPAWTGNVGLTYTVPGEAVGVSGAFSAGVNYQYVGSRHSDLANLWKMDAYHIVNARIGWENEKFGVHAFVENLLDQRPLAYAFEVVPGSGIRAAYIGRGRVVGAGASIKF